MLYGTDQQVPCEGLSGIVAVRFPTVNATTGRPCPRDRPPWSCHRDALTSL